MPDLPSPPGATPPRPRLLDQVAVLRYVAVESTPTYRAIVEAFVQAKDHYVIELRPAEVRERLDRLGLLVDLPDAAALDRHLDQLDAWGNLQRDHDSAAVTHLGDFYRRRVLYRLTPSGEAAHRAVREVEATVGRSGSLQVAMLLETRDGLAALAEAARAGDAPALVRALHRVRGAFESLVEEANLFLGELDRSAAEGRVEEDRFLLHKQALLGYLGRFVEELRRLRPEIAERAAEVEALGPAAFLAVAAAAAELPPSADAVDPAQRWCADEFLRWRGLHGWFVGEGATPPRVARLHGVAVDAVVRLTRDLARLNERRAGAVDRAADFRALARWFAACPDDGAAHELWVSAFGLHPARHFHLAEDDRELTPPTTSWWTGAPVEIPVKLRERGTVSRSGRPPPASDFSDGRAWMAARRRRERAQLERALARFAGRGPLHLSALAELDEAEFDRLLALLDEALAAPRDEAGVRRTLSVDGQLEVALHPPEDPSRWATLRTPAGALRCLDYELRVAAAAGASPRAEATP